MVPLTAPLHNEPGSVLFPPRPAGSRPLARALGIGLLIAICAPSLALFSRGFPNLFFEDDAYFYLQIARNIGRGAGSTFDGLHVTNGYHLLWTAVLVPFAALVSALGLGKTAFVAIVSGVGLGIAGVAAVVSFREPWARALSLLLFIFSGITMETVILAALVLWTLRMTRGEIESRPALIAWIAAATALSRVDHALVVPGLALTVPRDRGGPRLAMAAGAGALAGVACHFGLERLLFGVWSSVSAAYKADVAMDAGGPALLLRNLHGSGTQLRFLTLGALAIPTAWSLTRTRRFRELACLALVLMPIAVYSVLSELRDWYFLVSLQGALFFATRMPGIRPSRVAAALFALLLLAIPSYLLRAAPDMRRTASFVALANRELRPNDVIYQVDGTGFTGYWLSARVVNGDGLVNSWDYRRRLLRDELGGYLDEIGATYVLTNGAGAPDTLLAWHGLVVPRREARLALDAGPTRNPMARFRLFSIRPTLARP